MRWPSCVALVFGCSCGGSPGTLVNAGVDVAFVEEDGVLVATAPEGIVATTLDGKAKRVLFAERRSLEDVSADFGVWAASDSDTNLFVGELATATWRRVPELDGILSEAAVSPDGRTIAASRHADFGVTNGPEDDTIFLVDVASLRVDIVPKASERWPTTIRWAQDGSGLYLQWAHHDGAEWIDLATKRRVAPPDPLPALWASPSTAGDCSQKIVHDDFSTEIQVDDGHGQRVTAVRIEGRKRGFHDYGSDFGQPVFTPGCGYVMFNWAGGVWLADATKSGTNGPLVPSGDALFFADRRVLSGAP
jgi:hypothetical protein